MKYLKVTELESSSIYFMVLMMTVVLQYSRCC